MVDKSIQRTFLNNFETEMKMLIRDLWTAFMQLGFNWVTDKESSSIPIYFGQVEGISTHR